MATTLHTGIKVADEVWIATALLHKEHPDRLDFTVEEIVERARRARLHKTLRPGVYVHAVQHCVANRPANPGRYRMLFETAPGRRRLYREGDTVHPSRDGAKITPPPQEIPDAYADLLAWYKRWSEKGASGLLKNDPLLASQGSGKKLWADEPADEYVRRLREEWE